MCPILITPAAWAQARETGAMASDAVPAASATNRRRVIELANAIVPWSLFITGLPLVAIAGLPRRRGWAFGNTAMIGDILAGAKECARPVRVEVVEPYARGASLACI